MRHNHKQQGFAVLELILILVIVGLIGGTGYYVWYSKQVRERAQSDNPYASTDQNEIPWRTHRDTLLGIQYKYDFGSTNEPQTFDVTNEPAGGIKDVTSGKVYSIDPGEKMLGYALTSDFSVTNQPKDIPLQYNDCKTTEGIVRIVYQDGDSCMALVAHDQEDDTGEMVKTIYYVAQKKITGAKVSTVSFMADTLAVNDYSDKTLEAHTHVDQRLKVVLDSVRAL